MTDRAPLPSLRPMADGRCDHCRLQHAHCVCATLERLELRTHVAVVMHFSEAWRTSSTANLAHLALPNSAIFVRGRPDDPRLSLEAICPPDHQPLFLFPSERARVLEPGWVAEDPRPPALIVPDGSWRKAKKVHRRVPGLDDITHVTLPPGPPSRYRMRKQSHPGRVSTFEAIARALEVLEGARVKASLDALFDRYLEGLLYEHGKA